MMTRLPGPPSYTLGSTSHLSYVPQQHPWIDLTCAVNVKHFSGEDDDTGRQQQGAGAWIAG